MNPRINNLLIDIEIESYIHAKNMRDMEYQELEDYIQNLFLTRNIEDATPGQVHEVCLTLLTAYQAHKDEL